MFDNIKELKDKNILVIGLGKSGLSVIKKIAGFVKKIIGVDSNPHLIFDDNFAELENLKNKKNSKLQFILNEKSNEKTELLKGIDYIIVSPGISNNIPLIKQADKEGIPIWSELELGWRMLSELSRSNTVAVTGTNGKTTVVTLIQKILSSAGKKAVVCGNIGNPLVNTIERKTGENIIRVIEVSSFQLERVYKFNPFLGVLLNITTDHLDRHISMEEYAKVKFKLFLNMSDGQWAVFNIDDKIIKRKINESNYKDRRINLVYFSLKNKSNSHVYYNNNNIYYKIGSKFGKIDISGIKLTGNHNISNIMSAICVSKIFNVSDFYIEETIKNFETLQNRIEFVAEINGIKIFNDSKATNPDATIKALESFKEKITLICGGKGKGMDFKSIIPYMRKKVLNLILIGEAKQRILNEIFNYEKKVGKLPFKVYTFKDFAKAVIQGIKITNPGNVLLLSPACASFDMFKDYKDRGEKFKKIILEYKKL